MPTESVAFAEDATGTPFYRTINRVDNYRYVAGQIDVAANELEGAFEALEGVRGMEFAHGDPANDIVRLSLNVEDNVPDAVDLILARSVAASPYHVYALANHTQFGPADAPENLTPSPPDWANDFPQERTAAGNKNPLVIIIDTGILPPGGTPFPRDSLVHSSVDPDANGGGPELLPYAGHGTFVAGLVLLQAPGARLVVLRPANLVTINENAYVADGDLADALRTAFEVHNGRNARVLNLSLAGPMHDGADPGLSLTRTQLTRWVDAGVTVVAAAGNDHSDQEHYPGAYKDVICVGATDEYGHIAEFSNYGPWVNIYAPGVDSESWYIKDGPGGGAARTVTVTGSSRRKNSQGPWNGYAKWSGTSFAAPYVAGLIAR